LCKTLNQASDRWGISPNGGTVVIKSKKFNEAPTGFSADNSLPDALGKKLRSLYNEVADQPVPDRFLDLLSQLEAATSNKKDKSET
jgi:Anti-sigma factor NepR